jgi:UDPglucose 6-dehydrogenase
VLGSLRGRIVAILGLTYKPGTNTLRRSSAVETCRWLLSEGAEVQAFDPAVKAMPEDLRSIRLMKEAGAALGGAEAVLIATPWPEFLSLTGEMFLKMQRTVVLDPARFLEKVVAGINIVEYHGIGISR